jgi:AcrR family transcriptional regulator
VPGNRQARDLVHPRHADITVSAYAPTVSELLDRRARKKAQTREQIRGIAHRLFDEHGFDAVTIADVARQADVAVQTVFNHFATKEDLFFDGRVDWVGGPAEAVRSRAASVPPLTAVREYLVELARSLVSSLAHEERRRYTVTLLASDALRAHERELIFETERQLRAALSEAWSDGTDTGGLPGQADPGLAAALTAAIWCSSVRVLIHEQRPRLTAGVACPEELASAVETFTSGLLAQLESNAPLTEALSGRSELVDNVGNGWPLATQRAG